MVIFVKTTIMRKGYYILFGFLLLLPLGILAQDEEEKEEEVDDKEYRGLSIGINLGTYFGNKKTASFYNGTGAVDLLDRPDDIQLYSIDERLDGNRFLQTYQQITNEFNATGYEIPYDTYPLNMRYSPAFNIGIQLKYNVNKYAAFIFNFNTMKLKSVDVFTIKFIGTTQQQNAQEDIRTFEISGNEQRFEANLGFRQGWEVNPMTNYFFQFGGCMLGTKVEKNRLRIGENYYDLFVGAANPNQLTTLQNSPTGVGFGGYFSTGFEFFIKERYTADISFGMSRDKVVMFSYEKNVWNKWLMATFTVG
jgi:hypothetical protein